MIGGLPVAQTYRNRDVVQGGLTTRWELAPNRNLVLALRGAAQDYTDTPPGTASPDSRSLTVLAGLDDASDGLWHYRLLGGYERRGFASPAFPAHGALVGEADAIFTPGGMTTITASVNRAIEDAAQEGVAGYVGTTGRMRVDYEWRRNVLFDLTAGIQHADLLGGGGTQTTVLGGVGATWLLNRRVRLVGTWDISETRTTGGKALSGSFVRSVELITMRLGW